LFVRQARSVAGQNDDRDDPMDLARKKQQNFPAQPENSADAACMYPDMGALPPVRLGPP